MSAVARIRSLLFLMFVNQSSSCETSLAQWQESWDRKPTIDTDAEIAPTRELNLTESKTNFGASEIDFVSDLVEETPRVVVFGNSLLVPIHNAWHSRLLARSDV